MILDGTKYGNRGIATSIPQLHDAAVGPTGSFDDIFSQYERAGTFTRGIGLWSKHPYVILLLFQVKC